jgi:hypothetical protein
MNSTLAIAQAIEEEDQVDVPEGGDSNTFGLTKIIAETPKMQKG